MSIFEFEQNYLTTRYQQLQTTLAQIKADQEKQKEQGQLITSQVSAETKYNFDSFSDNLDTFAALETINKQIDMLNLKTDSLSQRADQIQQLLKQPYFAKINLTFTDEPDDEDFYLGAASFTDQSGEPLIYDWRSPIADVYYQQQLGATSYQANDQTIPVELNLRRQFDLHADHLNAYYDTQVAIEDPLLLATLAQNKTNQMSNITATIQKEQNSIIRDTRQQHTLINGVAGSGKTSVVFQRIAYLLYRQRDQLTLNQMLVISPNQLFQDYIKQVLPELGEKAPLNLTLLQLIHQLSPEIDHIHEVPEAALALTQIQLTPMHFKPLPITDLLTIDATTSYQLFIKTPTDQPLDQRIQAVQQQLLQLLKTTLHTAAKTNQQQSRLASLTESEQQTYFGRLLPEDQALDRFALKMLKIDYADLADAIQANQWLAFEQITADFAPHDTISQARLYSYLNQLVYPQVKQLFVDEVQDYSQNSLLLLRQLFPKAQFTLLGDQYQSLQSHKIQFDQLPTLFPQLVTINLLTSYRSSGAITALFGRLLPPNRQIHAVQPTGVAVERYVYPDQLTAKNGLQEFIHQLSPDDTLALIAPTSSVAGALAAQLSIPVLNQSTASLPTTGAFVLPLKLAKGLEFDHVILVALNDQTYADGQLGRNRLYTAISRATKTLMLTAEKTFPSILKD